MQVKCGFQFAECPIGKWGNIESHEQEHPIEEFRGDYPPPPEPPDED